MEVSEGEFVRGSVGCGGGEVFRRVLTAERARVISKGGFGLRLVCGFEWFVGSSLTVR